MTSPADTRLVGSVLGERYELVRSIAREDTTELYEAHDRALQRQVAVKLFPQAEAMDRARFEAAVAGLLEDPSVHVYDASEWGDDGGYVVVDLADEVAPPVVVVGDRPVRGDDPTTVIAVGGDTTVMPVPVRPEVVDDDAPAVAAAGAGRALWLALAAIALVVVLLAAQGGGGIEAPPPTTDPVAVTSPPPPTTAPPTTVDPGATAEPTGKGKGKGRGNKDDD